MTTESEAVRQARVRQLWKERPAAEHNSETGIQSFFQWLESHYPELIPHGQGDGYQRLRAELMSTPRTLTWTITTTGASYRCTNCSWSIDFDRERIVDARKAFDQHVCG
jgi:hypothetical protein